MLLPCLDYHAVIYGHLFKKADLLVLDLPLFTKWPIVYLFIYFYLPFSVWSRILELTESAPDQCLLWHFLDILNDFNAESCVDYTYKFLYIV